MNAETRTLKGLDFMIFDDFLMGAILKKMVIYKKENALRVADFLNRHSQFENRSLVDFEIGNERKSHKFAYL